MSKTLLFKIMMLGALLFPLTSYSQATTHTLIIGTKVAPPFAMKDKDGDWQGISIELWKQIADKLNYSYEWKELDLDQLLEDVSKNKLDVAIAAITITSEREKQFDFSHSYYSTGLSIAIPKTSNTGWPKVFKGVFSTKMLLIILLLSLLLLIIGTLTWLLERKKNPENFSPNPIRGIASGFWWAAVTMTTVGYGDMTPKSLGGRIIALFWMFASILLVAAIIAGVASALTVARIEPLVSGPQDLAKGRIATIKNSISDIYLKDRRLHGKYYASVMDGLQSLNQGKVDAMLYDAPLLKYHTNLHFQDNIKIVDNLFELQNYGIAFPENSPLREAINRVMLDITHQSEWHETLRKYLGD